jgi:hypothetical protein
MNEELKNLKFGALISKDDIRDFHIAAAVPIDNELPKEYIIPDMHSAIYDQKDSSECVAFALRWLCEWMNKRELKQDIRLSEKFIFGNRKIGQDSRNLFSFEGMYPREAISNLKSDGVCEEKYMDISKVKYNEWYEYENCITSAARENALKYRIKSYVRIYTDVELKNALVKVGAVLASIPITDKFKLTEKYIPLTSKEYADKNKTINHMIVVIGYKKYNGKEYWVCVDSYGKESHDNGIFYYEVGSMFNELWTIMDDITPVDKPKYWRTQVGAYSIKLNAQNMQIKLKNAGFATYLVQVNGLYKVQTGCFSIKTNAESLSKQLKAKGFDNFITYY